MKEYKLSLSMIMKNESHVLPRLLKSVLPIIDYWVIVDTGSTDGSQELVKKFFEENNVPGELIEIEWKDFATSRNIALEATEKKKAEFGFWIDCDEELIIDSSFDKEKVLNPEMDSISLHTIYGRVNYVRKEIWKTGRNFKWNGPIHELLSSSDEKQGDVAKGLSVIVRPEGSSWSNVTEKYLAHAKILEEYTKDDPDPRWVFYTGQSYRDAGEYEKSIEWYTKRCTMPSGFVEEIFISRFMIAKLSEITNKDKAICTALYQEAHATDPLRGESIKALVQMYQRLGDWENAYVFSQYGLRYNRNNPYPNRILFIDNGVYDFEMLELHSLSCFYTRRIEEGSKAYWIMRAQLDQMGKDYLNKEQAEKIVGNEKFFPKLPNPNQKSAGKSNHIPPKKKRK